MVSLISHMQQFLRRTLFNQHANSDNCLLEIVHLGIGCQFWFQPRIAYQLYLMLIIHIYDRIYISNYLYLGIHIYISCEVYGFLFGRN